MKSGMTVLLGSLATVAFNLIVSLRLSDARDLLAQTLDYANAFDDLKIKYITALHLASIARLMGDPGSAKHYLEAAESFYAQKDSFRTAIPVGSDLRLVATLTTIRSWLALGDGQAEEAVSILTSFRTAHGLESGDSDPIAYHLVLAHELNCLVGLGELQRAGVLADAEFVTDMLDRPEASVLAGPLATICMARGDVSAAARIVQLMDDRYGLGLQIPATLLFAHLGRMAQACASVGESCLTLACTELATRHSAMLTSGRWSNLSRVAALEQHSAVRDHCLLALSQLPRSAQSSMAVIRLSESWREQSLRQMIINSPSTRSPRLLELLEELRGVLNATSEGESSGPATYQQRLGILREELRSEVSEGYASLVAPMPLDPEQLAPPEDEVWISASIVGPDESTVSIVSVVAVPENDPVLRCTELSAAATSLIQLLEFGFDPVAISQVDKFQTAWDECRLELGFALGLDLIEDATWASSLPIRAAMDEQLASLPVGALCLDGPPMGQTRPVTQAPFLGRRQSRNQHNVHIPRVLAHNFSEAEMEHRALLRLYENGRLHLTVAETVGAIVDHLAEEKFDVLVLSAHGDGAGIEYRVKDHSDSARELYVHDLFGLQVPRWVIASSCFSGRGGGTDISGLLATLLAHGAQEVLSSTWAIPAEETSEILCNLFDCLDRPGSLAANLGRAQASFLAARPDRQSVYWWGGLTVTSLGTLSGS
jgi:hypothetical protein